MRSSFQSSSTDLICIKLLVLERVPFLLHRPSKLKTKCNFVNNFGIFYLMFCQFFASIYACSVIFTTFLLTFKVSYLIRITYFGVICSLTSLMEFLEMHTIFYCLIAITNRLSSFFFKSETFNFLFLPSKIFPNLK